MKGKLCCSSLGGVPSDKHFAGASKQRPKPGDPLGLTATLLALGTSALYDTSGFLAGVLAKRMSAVLLALWSQIASGAVLLGVVLVSAQRPSFRGLLWRTAASIVGAAGVLVFYPALVPGPTSLVALLAAVCFGAFTILLDKGRSAAKGGELWATLGIQLGAFPTYWSARSWRDAAEVSRCSH